MRVSPSASTSPMTAPVDARGFLARVLAAPRTRLTVITVPAPLARLETLLHIQKHGPALLWDPPSGPSASGIGEAVRLTASGPDRFRHLRDEAATVLASIDTARLGEAGPPVRLFGGLAFAPGAADAAPWAGFGDATFVLPRWRYARSAGRAWLSLAASPDLDVTQALADADRLLAALEADRPVPPQGIWEAEVRRPGPEVFAGLVEAIRAGIHDGRFTKVVAALRGEVHLPVDLDVADVVHRLGAEHPDCFRFALRFGARTFLGATPERLVSRSGARVDADALAGSIAVPAGGPGEKDAAATRLLGSEKDRGEQQIVVDALREALSPMCTALTAPKSPRVLTLRHVMHLHTPLTGVLADGTHLLDLAEAVHPTPAVGGVPRERAVRWIAEHEPDARGWYAGPVGWFDASGDGELAVAIRSGLVSKRDAFVYAGAGIVGASEPLAEYAETAVKQRALLRALGIVA